MDGRPNRRNKAPFRDGLVWTVGLTVEIKLRFRDGFVWTVGLTVEIKLHFQTPPAYCGRELNFNQFSNAQRIALYHKYLTLKHNICRSVQLRGL